MKSKKSGGRLVVGEGVAVVSAHEVRSADGDVTLAISIYCPTCERWSDVDGVRRRDEAASVTRMHDRLPFAVITASTPIAQIMTRYVIGVRPDLSIDALSLLFVDKRISGAVVLDESHRSIGFVSVTDVLQSSRARGGEHAADNDDAAPANARGDGRQLAAGLPARTTVSEIMTSFVFSLPSSASVAQAAALMAYEGVHRLAVHCHDGTVVGMISAGDVMRWIGQSAGYVIPGEPVAQHREVHGESGVWVRRPSAPRTVLLVDDDEELRDHLALTLRSAGYFVRTASNGQEALDRLGASDLPSLILFDLNMPVMNGWAFRKEVERHPELGGIPMIVLSGSASAAHQLGERGVEGVLQKPVSLSVLLGTVQRYCA